MPYEGNELHWWRSALSKCVQVCSFQEKQQTIMKLGESSEPAQTSEAGNPVRQSSDWQEKEAELLKQNEVNPVKEEKFSVGKYRENEE